MYASRPTPKSGPDGTGLIGVLVARCSNMWNATFVEDLARELDPHLE